MTKNSQKIVIQVFEIGLRVRKKLFDKKGFLSINYELNFHAVGRAL